ncbi:MAG: AMP-binding protein, partial [Candidatus Marinimicrobia bacterium]|nr:AMP-binding protein [Candidatus Neomarinimicrobiota bacterium]
MKITPQILFENANNFSSESALSFTDKDGNWVSKNWKDLESYVLDISKALYACGVGVNDKVSIYSYNRIEWYAGYLATQVIGGVGVGVYHTCSSDEVKWIVENSDSKVVFVGNNPMDNDDIQKMPNHRLLEVLDSLPKVETVVMMHDIEVLNHEKCISWEEFLSKGKEILTETIRSTLDQITKDHSACLIYTSGTTGNPKGVELTHKNWSFEIRVANSIFKFNQGEKYISWLPLAHVFGQLIDVNYWVQNALHLHVCDSPLKVVDCAKEVKPHLFIGVPRIYEKI